MPLGKYSIYKILGLNGLECLYYNPIICLILENSRGSHEAIDYSPSRSISNLIIIAYTFFAIIYTTASIYVLIVCTCLVRYSKAHGIACYYGIAA